MIYLIDDKKTRQKNFGWTKEKFAQYANHLTPLYSIDDVSNIGESLYNDGSIILYHESFLDFTDDRERAIEQRNKLAEKAASINGLSIAFFSGSQSSRSLEGNMAYLPVSVLYQNLEVLVQQRIRGNMHLKFLLFGENPDVEEKLEEKLIYALNQIDSAPAKIAGQNLFIRTDEDFIQNAIDQSHVKIIIDESDVYLSKEINECLAEIEYDNIFIPLCFGQTLSDYNGLRLATHIRCNPSPNQLKKIFIYSFVSIEYLLDNEYFNILKTKNVELVSYSKKAFGEAANRDFQALKIEKLPQEIAKLKLDPPLNYVDSHSIVNEWAIYQWAKTIGAEENQELQKVFNNVESNLYFKYLKTIYPVSIISQFHINQLKIKYDGSPRVLLIDDESEKGWYELFAYLLGDINHIYPDYLGEGFNKLSREEIIDKSIQQINETDIDIVILDFRLSPDDFDTHKIEDVSSIQLLKKIKKINPGIQVIIFSATNKIWNLQAMQDAGADGFVLKESLENSAESEFTSKSIKSFINEFVEATNRIFLKDFYRFIFQVEENIRTCDYEDDSDYEDFLKDLKSQIKVIGQSGREMNPKLSTTLDVIFLNCYNFLEKFKNYYLIEKDYDFYLGAEEVPLHRYQYKGGSIIDEGEFTRSSGNDNPSWFQCMTGLLVDYFQVLTRNTPAIKILWLVKGWRNNYMHEKKSSFSHSELLKISDLMVKITSSMKE